MNFYKHHLGDYDGHTTHLSWDEDLAYTRLLRAYYRRDGPIPEAETYRLCRAATSEQRAAVDAVVKEFFVKAKDGWHNKRADEEIAAYQVQAEHNRKIGVLGGRPRITHRVISGNPERTQVVPGTEPGTNPDVTQAISQNQIPERTRSVPKSSETHRVISGLSETHRVNSGLRCLFDNCINQGILSDSTAGQGPFYCRAHFNQLHGYDQPISTPKDAQDSLQLAKALIKGKKAPTPEKFED